MQERRNSFWDFESGNLIWTQNRIGKASHPSPFDSNKGLLLQEPVLIRLGWEKISSIHYIHDNLILCEEEEALYFLYSIENSQFVILNIWQIHMLQNAFKLLRGKEMAIPHSFVYLLNVKCSEYKLLD